MHTFPFLRRWRPTLGAFALACALAAVGLPAAHAQQQKPNILIIWGDDIGTWNISHNHRGMMGYETPNIDRLAREGLSFTDYYGQQSCTAGRASFLGGNVPARTGMTKVGIPGAAEGWQKTDVTIATVMKSLGYATGQFGKNHQGDRDEHLPTMHGFDEFFGNLYHLNAEEEPENEDYPRDMKLPNGKIYLEQFGPRGVLKSKADGKGGQAIENTGPLTKKRMETIDDETLAAANTPFRSEKNSNWEGAYRVPAFVHWPGHFPAGKTLNGIMSHEDWLPTLAASAGAPDIVDKLKAGVELNGRTYRNYIDGYNQLDYLSGKTDASPRKEFWYVNDDGQIVAARYHNWKGVFLENRGEAFEVWREPFVELRVPLLFNLRRDPFERAQHHSNTYNDWFMDWAYVLVPLKQLVAKFLMSMQDYPPSQTPGAFNLEKVQKQIEAAAGGK
jgi:arylsulfatase A-like enzyme